MEDLHGAVSRMVSRLSGRGAEDAWHSLVEIGSNALPHVIASFEASTNADVRLALVRVVLEWRQAEAVPFLATLLRGPETEVWKAALDGLVTIGGPSAADVLRSAIVAETPERQAWIQEAIDQIADAGGFADGV